MPYSQVTRAQFRALLEARLGAASTTFWRVTERNFIIQESLRFFNLITGFWKTAATITTSANTVWYLLPSTITSQMRVTFQSQPLDPSSVYDLDFGRPAWESETTVSGGDVPPVPKVFAIGGLNLLAIWPADAAGNNQLDVDGIASTPILTADNQNIDLGQDEMKILLDYCQHIASFKEGGKEFQATSPLFKSFLKAAGERSAILKASAMYRKFLGLDTGRMKKNIMVEPAEAGAR